MTIAARIGAARYAVGALALAALAVSAREPEVEYVTLEPAQVAHARYVPVLGDAVIVGIPEYELVEAELARAVGQLSHCFPKKARVTIYAHAVDGRIDVTEWGASDTEIGGCAAVGLMSRVRLPVDDELSLMVPITAVD